MRSKIEVMAPIAVGMALLSGAASAGPLGGADTETFLVPIPDINQEFFLGNGIIPGSNDFNGGTVIDARLELVLNVVPTDPGDPRVSSAEFFRSQILVPVDLEPAPGAQIPAIFINGADEGWSGTGEFTISRELPELVGGIWTSPLFYSAVTEPGLDNDRIVLGQVDFFNSFISVTVQIPAPAGGGALALMGLVAARRRR
jgi:hypothetical protein